jgi:hypothetical protein
MAPIQAIRSLHLPMRRAGFLLPTLAALALASCTAPPPSPPPTASVPPSAPQQQAPPPSPPPPPPPPPAAPASPMAKAIFEANRSGQAPFVSPGEMSLSGPPPGASPRSRLNSPPPVVEPPVNKQVADLLNSADTEQRSEYGGDGCFYVGMAISNANDRPTPTAQRAEVKRYADRCKLRFQP